MATANAADGLRGGGSIIKRVSGWSIIMALVFILLGMMAIIEPGVAGVALAILVGWVLIFGGVAHLITAFSGGGAARVIWQVLIGLVYIVGGFYFLTHPLLALGTLTLLLGVMILMEAVFELVAYFRARDERGSGWLLVNALITLLLGGLIWLQWPSSSGWAIGTLVGVNLLMTGISRLMFGLAARKVANRLAA
ncbi:MAG TPA: DUF308 domain-containing protein [Candidatus Binatus sp.]|jgi:uncharacterized membrane protein HdeD (DUF308 family)|nr:DUF308 domain-containing protein [Candidatus Binatus sp.]